MSLPGLRTYSQHTGVDSADHILKMFSLAKSFGMTTVVNSTVTRINLFELADTISAALLAGAEQVLLNRFLPGGRGMLHADELSLDIPQIQQMLDTAEEVLEKAGRFGSVGTEIPKCIADVSRYKRLQVGTRCSAAIQFFVVGPSGFVRVCNHSPVELNHVHDIEGLKSNDYWNRFVFKKYMPSECTDCRDFTACDGGCREAAHVVTSSVMGLDPALIHTGPLGVMNNSG
jgi:radical SAM protein with 4Fe4S-binding SPASM domain